MHAAILSIGDELTLGQTANTNATWLSQRLIESGIITIEHRTIGDDRAAIARSVTDLAERVLLIIITGGLGPTDDDLTREALADALTPGPAPGPGKGLVTDERALRRLVAWYRTQGRAMPALNRKQAMRPESMRVLRNPHGTAPGLAGELGSCLIFALPGPPREMQPMFDDHVRAALVNRAASKVVLSGTVEAYGIGESNAAELLGELMSRDRNPLVGTTVSQSILSARVRVEGSAQSAAELLESDLLAIDSAWHPYAYGRGGHTLAAAVGEVLRDRGRTLSTAESCTGGMLGSMIVDVAGSSDYYRGGWVTYSNDLKIACLGVDTATLDQHGAVSAAVAEAMANGARRAAAAEYSLAITGVAGPDGGTAEKPVGTVFIALATPSEVSVRRFAFGGDRWTIRDRSSKSALQMLRFELLEVDPETPLLWQVEARKPLRSPVRS